MTDTESTSIDFYSLFYRVSGAEVVFSNDGNYADEDDRKEFMDSMGLVKEGTVRTLRF